MNARLLDIQVREQDFRGLISEILQAGTTKAELARILNVPFMTLDRWMEGAQPRWHHGEAIRAVVQVIRSRKCVTPEAA